ncbi:hypothetical protein O6P43_021431 [Quillaja saponaria]|uniref:Uncharacterized protein n=1 Tax=Quillaja saponaria TaxID=32244 RepID=A0AAD7LAT3_QUISA|nr:hypothetical protein O6P43_021431 [Quillaja saponaria]
MPNILPFLIFFTLHIKKNLMAKDPFFACPVVERNASADQISILVSEIASQKIAESEKSLKSSMMAAIVVFLIVCNL